METTYRDLEASDIDRILAFLPRLESPKAPLYELTTEKLHIDPYRYSDEVRQFIEELYATEFIFAFDYNEWMSKEGGRYLSSHAIASADLIVLRRLITAYVRKERFCSGVLAEILDNGFLVAILRRLAELRATSS